MPNSTPNTKHNTKVANVGIKSLPENVVLNIELERLRQKAQ